MLAEKTVLCSRKWEHLVLACCCVGIKLKGHWGLCLERVINIVLGFLNQEGYSP